MHSRSRVQLNVHHYQDESLQIITELSLLIPGNCWPLCEAACVKADTLGNATFHFDPDSVTKGNNDRHCSVFLTTQYEYKMN